MKCIHGKLTQIAILTVSLSSLAMQLGAFFIKNSNHLQSDLVVSMSEGLEITVNLFNSSEQSNESCRATVIGRWEGDDSLLEIYSRKV